MTLVLRTERLVISPLGESDLDAFVAYRRHPDVARYQSWSPEYSLTDARALLAAQPRTTLPAPGEWLQLALRRAEQPLEGRLVGYIAIGHDASQPDTYELGVTLAPAHHGRGYAQEALTAALDALLGSHGAHRVVVQADARNERARAAPRGSSGPPPRGVCRRGGLVQGGVDDSRALRTARTGMARPALADPPLMTKGPPSRRRAGPSSRRRLVLLRLQLVERHRSDSVFEEPARETGTNSLGDGDLAVVVRPDHEGLVLVEAH